MLFRISIVIAFCIQFGQVLATHIVGGAFSLQRISGNQYELTLKVLRDCKNGQAAFDNPATIGIYDKTTHTLMDDYQLNLTSKTVLNFAGSNCDNPLPGECTEIGIYKKTITISPTRYNNNAGYYFSYQRCCRNGIITNIVKPGDAGIAIYMEIPSPKQFTNSTPDFSANPNTFLCVGNETRYNFNFTDKDGDQLRYSLVTPLNGNLDKNNPQSDFPSEGPYPNITWGTGYGDNTQIDGNPSLSIDPNTGELLVSPLNVGIFVAAVRVEEFRNGIKIGEVRLEIQFNVTTCPQPLPTLVFKDENGKIIANNFLINIPEKLCFYIETNDPKDSLNMVISPLAADTTLTFKPEYERISVGLKKVSTKVCWQTDCSNSYLTPQQFKVEVKDNGCPFPNRITGKFTIKTNPLPLVYPTDILCMTLIDNKETIFYWGDSTGENPFFDKYIIYRSSGSSYSPLDSIKDKSIRQYHDFKTPDYSSVNYTYFMRAKNLCGFEGPTSDTLGTFDQLKYIPDQQKLIVATVFEKNKIKIVWPKSREKDFARYFIYKGNSKDSNFSLIKTTTNIDDTVFIDNDVEVNKMVHCYHVVMKDTCDNYGPMGTVSCNILLSGITEPFKHNLNWNQYQYWEEGIQNYELFVAGDRSPLSIAGYPGPSDTAFLDNQLDPQSGVFTYFVKAIKQQPTISTNSNAGVGTNYVESFSNEIELSQKPFLFIPNAFTPNQDNTNEDWNIVNSFVKTFHVWVYDKWGKLVFETEDKNEKWIGMNKEGNFYPSDVYVYRLEYTGYDNSAYQAKGNVTILR